MSLDRQAIEDILSRVDLGDVLYERWSFRVLPIAHGFLLQLVYWERDTEVGRHPDPVEQHARKWYVSPHSTATEVVRTAYKAVLTSLEHRLGEHFRYGGQKPYNPHFDVEELRYLDRRGGVDVREDVREDVRPAKAG